MKHFRAKGYLVDIVEKIGNTYGAKDLFGLFDILAISKNETIFIQVTCNRPHTRKPYKLFANKYCGDSLKCQQYTWYDRKGWRVDKYEAEKIV